ncbi:hypothetical protein E2C01_006941 [Portunus trituberculatus]|uniref:Uncharacterized protein n=1 Tax=Portunus trituberculatus TaxID=210409 RepID=A0A5B7CWS0_PORTR|nr:hypothetical protein [Portunus trituberculatus]
MVRMRKQQHKTSSQHNSHVDTDAVLWWVLGGIAVMLTAGTRPNAMTEKDPLMVLAYLGVIGLEEGRGCSGAKTGRGLDPAHSSLASVPQSDPPAS